ncbi:MAG: 8-amino-7-oxononanoate synthase [Verrucomicrobia bacterium]|nr:8-amino-7-oxononanoate synthase [Verrucomicrobiota bacterium]
MPKPTEELAQLREQGLERFLHPLDSPAGIRVNRAGKSLWNFASNDYLGLASHPAIAESFIDGIKKFGTGSTASRLICGTLAPHLQLEAALAEAKQSQAALTFSSGFAAALGIIPAAVGKNDFVVLDKLSHACLIDAAKLSGATIRVFPHNDLAKLKSLLASIRAKSPDSQILVATESVFSMDGTICPLSNLLDVVEAFDAMLLLDEAHGFGVLGPTGMGLAEQENVAHRITFQMGTLSKAAGLSGAYVCASHDWIRLLINKARPFIYSTAPPPAIANSALTSLQIIRSKDGSALRQTLRENIATLTSSNSQIPIIPHILGSNEATLSAANSLIDAGFLVPAIRYPTVPRNTARLRISLSAAHPSDAVECLRAKLTA